MRLTIEEYSKQFKMSKEMINSKLKSRRLDYIVEDGVTYIEIPKLNTFIDDEPISTIVELKPKLKPTVATVISLYQKENQHLKEKIIQLEEKIDKLIDDKEQMLRDERDKIEEIYTTKDEQLKNILELMSSQIEINKKYHTQIEEIKSISHNQVILTELKEYLKSLDIDSNKRKIIKKRFLEVYNSDSRIIQQNGKLFLNFEKYDYSDLLKY